MRLSKLFGRDSTWKPPKGSLELEALDADSVASKVNGRKRGELPVKCEHLTAYVDLQQKLLFYAVCAWQADFTGYVIDYGTYPEQALS